jgi:hypothetical protein
MGALRAAEMKGLFPCRLVNDRHATCDLAERNGNSGRARRSGLIRRCGMADHTESAGGRRPGRCKCAEPVAQRVRVARAG